jgi:NADH:ubiquinone oxidoreductase subunit D
MIHASVAAEKDVYGNIEGLMNHFKLVIEGVKIPRGEVYQVVEGGNGELDLSRQRRQRSSVPGACVRLVFGMAAVGQMLRDV